MYGKDISDSLGGAIYNAVLSVDLNELDYMENVTLTNSGILTLGNSQNEISRLFGYEIDNNGVVKMINNVSTNADSDEILSNQVNKEVARNREILGKIKKDNPNTQLSDQELLDMYGSFTGGNMMTF